MKGNDYFKAYFEWVRTNPGISRMLKVLIMVIFLVHLTACFWFLTAKLDNFSDDTWVMRSFDNGVLNEATGRQYLISVYWSFMTLTTVGYG